MPGRAPTITASERRRAKSSFTAAHASEVLPMPPGPTRTTSGPRRIAAFTDRSSARRPTNAKGAFGTRQASGTFGCLRAATRSSVRIIGFPRLRPSNQRLAGAGETRLVLRLAGEARFGRAVVAPDARAELAGGELAALTDLGACGASVERARLVRARLAAEDAHRHEPGAFHRQATAQVRPPRHSRSSARKSFSEMIFSDEPFAISFSAATIFSPFTPAP